MVNVVNVTIQWPTVVHSEGRGRGEREREGIALHSLLPRLPNPNLVFLQGEEPRYEAKLYKSWSHGLDILLCVFTFLGQHLVTAIADKEYGYKTKSW